MFVRKSLYRNIILLVFAGLLFTPLQTDNLWWHEAINSGHIILFIFLFFVIYSQIKIRIRNTDTRIIYIYTLFIGILLGVAIEGLQTFVHREASLGDLYGNFFGLMAGLCLHAAVTFKGVLHKKKIVTLLISGSVGFVLFGVSPLLRLSWHYVERADALPVIMDFDANWSSSFSHQDEGSYPGVSIIEPEPDWSAYRTLYFSINSDSERNIKVVLRIHDRVHNQEIADRYNMKLLVLPGFNEFSIPLDAVRAGPAKRELDLSNIAGIILFTSKTEDWSQIKVGKITLQ